MLRTSFNATLCNTQVLLSLLAALLIGQCAAQSDADIYNFALNLEYLEVRQPQRMHAVAATRVLLKHWCANVCARARPTALQHCTKCVVRRFPTIMPIRGIDSPLQANATRSFRRQTFTTALHTVHQSTTPTVVQPQPAAPRVLSQTPCRACLRSLLGMSKTMSLPFRPTLVSVHCNEVMDIHDQQCGKCSLWHM